MAIYLGSSGSLPSCFSLCFTAALEPHPPSGAAPIRLQSLPAARLGVGREPDFLHCVFFSVVTEHKVEGESGESQEISCKPVER